MEKIIKLIPILDEKIVDRLIMLDRLVTLYTKFTILWTRAELTSDGATVKIKFFKINKYGYEQFTERIFPMEDIDKRIISYKGKIKREFIKRHDNSRLLREKQERSWRNYLKNGGITDA